MGNKTLDRVSAASARRAPGSQPLQENRVGAQDIIRYLNRFPSCRGRPYIPVLRKAALPAKTTVPWWGNRTLRYELA